MVVHPTTFLLICRFFYDVPLYILDIPVLFFEVQKFLGLTVQEKHFFLQHAKFFIPVPNFRNRKIHTVKFNFRWSVGHIELLFCAPNGQGMFLLLEYNQLPCKMVKLINSY